MRVNANTKVKALVKNYPEVEEILGWYDVELNAYELGMTLERLCRVYDLDLDDVLTDIEVTLGEEDSEGQPSLLLEDDEDEEGAERPEEEDEEEDAPEGVDEDDFGDDYDEDLDDLDDDEDLDELDEEGEEGEEEEYDWN